MDDKDIAYFLESCCWGIGEVLRNLPTCPHSSGKERGQLCADCVNLTTKLSLIAIQLEKTPEAGASPEIQAQALELLNILRDVCFWPHYLRQDHKWPLEKLEEVFDTEAGKKTVSRSISKYLKEDPIMREGLTKRCERLLKALQTDDKEDVVDVREPNDYSRSHKALFSTLCEYTPCNSCHAPTDAEDPISWHPTRLFLVDSMIDAHDLVHFDVLASSAQDGWWQDLCIQIPLKTRRRVAFTSDDDSASDDSATEPSTERLEGFCDIFESDDCCRISLKLQAGALFRVGVNTLKHRTSPGTGISLADVLDQYGLTVREKLSLAYSVTLSFWQYYDSQLMHRAWTSHTVWLMPEPAFLDEAERLPLRTYISFYPEATDCDYDASEFVKTNSLIHRCPRIQNLALLLLEIGLGKPFRGCSSGNRSEIFQLNFYNSIASRYLEELKSTTWENYAHKYVFTDAIEECLRFDGLTGKGGNQDPDNDHVSRRGFLQKRVLSRLERLNRPFQQTNAQVDYLSAKPPALGHGASENHLTSNIQSTLSTNDYIDDDMTTEIAEMRPADRWGFETAIICALTLEADAIEALFDHHWENGKAVYGKAPGDPNAYSTGVMGRHNVVLAHMSGMGKCAAASVAASCRMSFPNIKLAILVGICGAVPFNPSTRKDINLGDVILSEGVVQYDFGRQLPEGFERKTTVLDSLGRAGPEIRANLSKMKGIRGMKALQGKMARYLDKLGEEPSLQANYPVTQDSKPPGGGPPRCSKRSARWKASHHCPAPKTATAQKPAIHFGLIASGDTVMKSAEQRDDIARKENVIAFEMEGAAVWETFPCLVIKGACDYADSNKTKVFQRYAAATAAACTKAFLDSWQFSESIGHA